MQISAGIWQLLTLNVSVLPSLRLEQWQIVFDIVALGSKAGGFAAMKSFEVIEGKNSFAHTLAFFLSFFLFSLKNLFLAHHIVVMVSGDGVVVA